MANENTPDVSQKTLRLTDYQGLTIQLAQRIHNQLAGEAQALLQQGRAKEADATTTLRAAVEGAFREHGVEIPQAEVKIVNDERGRPAVFTWVEAPKPDPQAETEGESAEAEEAPAELVAPAPVAEKKPAPPVNGKAAPAHPEAAKRKLPVK
jgi:hypothetical protein